MTLANGLDAFKLSGMVRKPFVCAILAVFCLFFMTAAAAAASKPNLVLITLDSVRADHMGFLGAKGGLAPNLNHLAAESIVFEHAYAQAPGTLVSHATLLSGAYPQSTGLTDIGGTLTPSLPYLPELLKAQGYRTAAFVGSIDLDPVNGLAQGFDRHGAVHSAGVQVDVAHQLRDAPRQRAFPGADRAVNGDDQLLHQMRLKARSISRTE